MGRLNQSRRQKIGYSYCPQVINNVAIQPTMRNMSLIQEQSFDQNMKGEGAKDVIRGIIANKKEILDLGKRAVDIASRIEFDKPKSKDVAKAGQDGSGLSVAGAGAGRTGQSPYDKPLATKSRQGGSGLSVAGAGRTGQSPYDEPHRAQSARRGGGGSRGSIQPSVGSGLSVAGGSLGMHSLFFGKGAGAGRTGQSPYDEPHRAQSARRGGSLKPAGDGAIDINNSKGNKKEPELPGDALKKKLLQKMVRERKMKAIGDRVKSAPIEAGMNGGSLVIPTINNKKGSQSMSKTLPSSKGYKLSPHPLVGGAGRTGQSPYDKPLSTKCCRGGGGADITPLIKHLQKELIPMLKSKGLVSKDLKNTDKIKKLIGLRVKKLVDEGIQDPQKLFAKVVMTLKPIMRKTQSGSGIADSIGLLVAKLLWKSYKWSHPNSVFVKGFSSGRQNQEGGFIIAGLIALGSAIAAAASAAAATTVVGTVTVGSLAGAALSGAAGVAGAAVAKKITGGGLKDTIVKVAKETKIAYRDLSKTDKDKIKSEFEKLKQNKNKAGVINFAKAIAPIALKATQKKLQPEFTKVFKEAGLSGSGLKIAGSGLNLAGKGEKQFKNEFVKHMIKVML